MKCDQYWPSRGTETYGLIQVTLIDTVELATYCVRTFALYKVYILIYTFYILWKAGISTLPPPLLPSPTSLLSLCTPSFCLLPYLCAFFPYFHIPFLPFPSFHFSPLFPSNSTEHWDFFRVLYFPDDIKYCKLMQGSHNEKPEYHGTCSAQVYSTVKDLTLFESLIWIFLLSSYPEFFFLLAPNI